MECISKVLLCEEAINYQKAGSTVPQAKARYLQHRLKEVKRAAGDQHTNVSQGHHQQQVQPHAQADQVLPLRKPMARSTRHAENLEAIGGMRHPKEANDKAGCHTHVGKQMATLLEQYLDRCPGIEDRLIQSIRGPFGHELMSHTG